MAITNIKRGDTEASWYVNFDLTSSTVKVWSRPQGGGSSTQLTSTITDAAAGKVTATVSALTVGTYEIEVEVTTAGKVATFPDTGYSLLVVNQDLG